MGVADYKAEPIPVVMNIIVSIFPIMDDYIVDTDFGIIPLGIVGPAEHRHFSNRKAW